MTAAREVQTLKRNCEATRIPYGDKLELSQGMKVEIVQSLGGSFTVITPEGTMVSIASKDADALGKETVTESSESKPAASQGSLDERVWAELRKCYDPEIPHNIVDLGLVYGCDLVDAGSDQKNVIVTMTLTAPGCGMGDSIKQDVASKVKTVSGVKDVTVNMVFDPPWDQSRINPKLKPYLGM